MLTKKIPVYTVPLALLSGVAISFFFFGKNSGTAAAANAVTDVKHTAAARADGGLKLVRQKGYELINPLLSVTNSNESNELAPLKAKIANVIEDGKRIGVLSSASVYLCDISSGDWFSINQQEGYHPGSLIKVPMMITYLKQAETDPQLLSKKITYATRESVPTQTYNAAQLVPGNSYSVADLIHYMVAYSDNNATQVLNRNANVSLLKKVFTDLDIPEPDVTDRNYQINAVRYSEFMIVLYNSTYLPRASSEFALEQLSQCGFRDGLMREIPANVKVSHKFGEWGDVRMNIHELHESGIVYLANRPYLITIMTKGNTTKELSNEISKISKVAYDHLSAM